MNTSKTNNLIVIDRGLMNDLIKTNVRSMNDAFGFQIGEGEHNAKVMGYCSGVQMLDVFLRLCSVEINEEVLSLLKSESENKK